MFLFSCGNFQSPRNINNKQNASMNGLGLHEKTRITSGIICHEYIIGMNIN